MATLVFSEAVVLQAPSLVRYFGGNFIHHALLFELLAVQGGRVYWWGSSKLQKLNRTKMNTWTDLTYEIWAKRWTEHVLSLPDTYPLSAKLKCIADHGALGGVFSWRRVLSHRSSGLLNYNVWKRYRLHLKLASPHPFWTAVVARMPRTLASILKTMIDALKAIENRLGSVIGPRPHAPAATKD
jgi:hypothetical protein